MCVQRRLACSVEDRSHHCVLEFVEWDVLEDSVFLLDTALEKRVGDAPEELQTVLFVDE